MPRVLFSSHKFPLRHDGILAVRSVKRIEWDGCHNIAFEYSCRKKTHWIHMQNTLLCNVSLVKPMFLIE